MLAGESGAVEAFVRRMSCARRFLTYKNASFGAPLGVHEVEDAVQSTLLAVWRKLDEYAGLGALEAWVARFAYLELMNRLHALDRRPLGLDRLGEDEHAREEREPRPDPFEREHLYRGLERLEADAARIIRLKHLDDLTFESIAEQLTVPINTVKTRYYRGMERLRQLLRDPRTVEGGTR